MRTIIRSVLRRLRDFVRQETGMTLPLLALSMVMITGMTGMAIDMGRAQMVQSKLQFSLDAAGLAAGSTVSTTDLNQEVNTYLNTNFNGYMSATIANFSATTSSNNTVINLTAQAQMPTTFMNVLGISQITVNASSQISRAVTGLELVMVLDNTGSMADSAGAGVSKIQALQSAADTLVSTLFGGQASSTNGKLWVGIVPFSQAVNIGTGHPTWMNASGNNTILTKGDSNINSMSVTQGPGWGPTTWGGCVDARVTGNEDVTDDPPSQGSINTLFDEYYWPSDSFHYGSPFNNQYNSGYNKWATQNVKECNTKTGKCTTVTNVGSPFTCPSGDSCTYSYTYSSPLNTTQQGPNYLCPQQVTPMTNVASTLTTAINAMQPEGDTLINQGLQWGWFMLSPRWQGLWGGTMNSNGLPLAYNTPGMAKAIVLVTDGENTIDNTAHGAYWFIGNDLLGTTNSTTGETDLNNKTLQLCTAMKNAGIYIYTIALGTDPSQEGLAMLQSCATASNYYFDSPSTSQLQGIFNEIGDSLSNLRVSH